MAIDVMQLVTIFLLIVIHGDALKPSGYVEPQKESDPSPPRYEYGYNVNTDKGAANQGKQEERDGIYASGRYYVQGKDSNQDVRYFADDWGFHPAVEYSSAGPHSNSRTRFALGFEAVQQLKNKEGFKVGEQERIIKVEVFNGIQNNQPQLQGLPETGNLNKQGPQVLQTASGPSSQENQQQRAKQVPFLQSSNRDLSLTEKNQPQQQYPQLQTDSSSNQLPQQQLFIPQESSQTTSEQQTTDAQNIAYTQAAFEQSLQNTRVSVNPQRDGHLIFEHQQILVFPNQNRQQQETAYEQQKINEVIETQNLNQENFEEFGLKIKPVQQKPNTKLIETTQHLVSGQDVLDINSAITRQQETSIESSTVQYSTSHQESKQENSQITYVSTTPCSQTLTSLREQPIVVADYDDANTKYSSSATRAEEGTEPFSTTIKSVESISTTYETPSPTTLIVTPRPVSTQFLAPITAAIRLQNIEQHEESEQKSNEHVQIQESVDYYLGKYEYPAALDEQVDVNSSSKNTMDYKAKQDLELGKTLLLFPELPKAEALVQRPYQEVDNHLTVQQLPNSDIREQFQVAQKHLENSAHVTEASVLSTQVVQELQQQEVHHGYKQEYQENNQQEITGYDSQNSNTNSVHVSQSAPEFTRFVQQPYPVRVPYEVPYPVVKQVSVPVTVQRVVEKPVHITRYIEKPVHVPQPYPVEKIVEKPVHIPVQITRYIDRPYPVEVRVPYLQPYPVEKLVHNIIRQPYPVEVKVPYPVEKIVEKKVHVPHYIEKPVTVEKIVEKPITRYVDRPYPVEKIVQKPVPHYVDRPYPVKVEVPVPQPFYIRVEVPRGHPVGAEQTYQRGLYQHLHEQNAQQSQQQAFFSNPYAYAPQVNQYLPPRKEVVSNNNGYLPPKQFTAGYLPPKTGDCSQHQPEMGSGDHFGLIPPKVGNGRTYTRTFRSARQFDDNSVRMEYGFMPPMVPSLEIDDKGNPLEEGEKK